MDSWIDSYVGEWKDAAGNYLSIRKITEETARVTFLAAPGGAVQAPAGPMANFAHRELSSSLAKELAELAHLHQTGVISDDEFTRAKSKLLSS